MLNLNTTLPQVQKDLFLVNEYFHVSGSKTTNKDDFENYGIYNYVTTQNINNGVQSKASYYTEPGNCITIDSATIGAVYYQEKPFLASDHVEVIRCKHNSLNKFHYLYIVTVLKLEQYRYGYGRKWNQKNIRNTKILLPSKDGKPDWDFMEKYVKCLPFSRYL